jgi:hypothetical protein
MVGRLTGHVNRKKKKTLGEVVTEEVKFQDSFKMKMLATGYAFMYMVYTPKSGSSRERRILTT